MSPDAHRIGFQERISAVDRHWPRIRLFLIGGGLLLCGFIAGCGASRSTVQSDQARPSSTATAAVEATDAPTTNPDAPTDIQRVTFDGEAVDDSPPATGWTLSNFESLALAHNPAIQQATASAHKAMGFRDQVGRKPNPTIGYNGAQLFDRSTDQHVAFIEQDFVTAGKLGKNRNVLEQEVQSQLWEVQTQRQRVLTDIRRCFYKALAAQRRLELAKEFQIIARNGVKTAEDRLAAKEGNRPDILQSEIQLKQVETQLRQAEASVRASWKQLVVLSGVPETAPQPLVGTLPDQPAQRDWQQVSSEILGSSPELRSAQSRLARAQANIDRQEAQSTPNITVMVAAGNDRGTHSKLWNTQVGLPLPLHNANQGNISAAHAEYCRAAQDVRRTELAIESRLAQAQNDYESAAAAVEQYRDEILPRAARTLELIAEAKEAGEYDATQVLIARRTYFDTHLAYLTAQLDLAQAESLIDGLVLTGGLETTRDVEFDGGLRDQALSGR